jgi:hypothetical protein
MQRNLTPDFTTNQARGESLFLAEELSFVLRYPDGESEIAVLLPLSLLAKLWPELTETLTARWRGEAT